MQFLSLRSTITKRAAGAVVSASSVLTQQTCNASSSSCCGGHKNLIQNNAASSSLFVAPTLTSAVRTTMTEVRPGDWLCANCGENNFRFRTHCNLCSKPRSPGAAGGNGGGDDGSFDDENGVSRGGGRGRGGNREGGAPRRGDSPKRGFGDWNCNSCQALNFKFRTECYSCREPRPAADIAAAAQAAAKKGNANDLTEANMKPGDWKCTDCGSINFRGRAACFACRTPKSSSALTKAGGVGGGKAVMKRGDWLCQSCSEHNFRDRSTCFRCGNARGDAKGYEPTADEAGGGVEGKGRVKKNPEDQPAKEGDWMCGECGVSNFRRRAVCFKCNKPKAPNAAVVGGGAPSGATTDDGEGEAQQTPVTKKKEEKPDDPLDDL